MTPPARGNDKKRKERSLTSPLALVGPSERILRKDLAAHRTRRGMVPSGEGLRQRRRKSAGLQSRPTGMIHFGTACRPGLCPGVSVAPGESPPKEQREQRVTSVHRNKVSAGVCRGRPVVDPNLAIGRSDPCRARADDPVRVSAGTQSRPTGCPKVNHRRDQGFTGTRPRYSLDRIGETPVWPLAEGAAHENKKAAAERIRLLARE